MGERLCRAGGAPPRPDSQRNQQARLAVLDPHHQPFGRRTAAVPAFGHDGGQRKRAHRDRQSGAKRMIAGFPLSFAEPFLLLGLLSLPVLWWLLRVMPPRPRRVEFPPTRLLFDIAPKEETPSHTPWWLTALRLLAAALVILAAAGPIWNPQTGLAGTSAPLVILLDDGWSAAASWDTRIKAADELIANADSDRRGVALVPLSEPARDITLMPAGTARVALRQLAPKPYSIERVETLPSIERFLKATGNCEIAWLSDGVDTGRGSEFLEGLSKTIGDRGLTVFDGGTPPPLALAAAENAAAKMTVKVLRTNGGVAAGVVRAIDPKGSPIGEARYTFAPQARETEAAFDLPVELRNDIARLEIAGERSAGAVQLLDKRWRRRAIGIVSGSTNETAQPLLASTFYLTRALAPFADVRLGDRGAPQQAITQFLDEKLPMIVLADVGTLSPEIRERLAAWIEQGGVLVRFAGPRLAQADDDLVPVKLRRGGRILGGSLTWEKPQHLASFTADGPFAGLAVPKDITVNRQVLAEPDAALATKSWASLEDGTPLVTGEHRGKGVSCQRRHALVRSTDVRLLRRNAEKDRRYVRLHVQSGSGRCERGEGRNGGAAAHAGWLRRVRTAALDGEANAGGFPRSCDIRSSARILRSGRRSYCGQYAGGRGSHRAARYFGLARAACQLHQCRTARSARHSVVLVAGTIPDRRDRRRHARRRHRGVAETARRAGCIGVRVRPVHDVGRATAVACRRQRRFRNQGGVANPAGLCRHRQFRRGFHRQGRHVRTDLVSRATHGAGGRRPRRRRSRPRRTGLLSADLLARYAGSPEAAARRHQPYRRLHETGRHRGVRYPRCDRGAARRRRRIANAGNAGFAQYPLLA